jgi:hypothetical protein
MQTFLPHPDFAESARMLDDKRLGKQRLECKQILRALGVGVGGKAKGKGWQNHPATRMWRGHEFSLCHYAIAVCSEWRNRGHRDGLLVQFLIAAATVMFFGGNRRPPKFIGDRKFHASHRSNLLRKNRRHYSQFGWSEPDDLPYVWPV